MNLSPELYNASLANLPAQYGSPVKKASEPYPVQQFPSVIRNVIQALHNNTQIPVELIGNVVLAAMSLTCQSLIEVIQPHTNMPEPCSLYLMTIAESGEGKTTINKQVMKPCYTFAAELIQQYKQQIINFNQNFKLWKIRQQALESNLRQAIKKNYSGENEESEIRKHAQIEPLRPSRPNFIYEDTSFKALVEGLNEHPEAGFISDEAITFFKSYLKNNPGLLNKAWDGEMFDFRRADGEIYQITPRLTFSLMSQPGVFMDYINKHGVSARASGFLSRFLFSWVESSMGSRQATHDKIDVDHDLNIFHQRLEQLLQLNKHLLNNCTSGKKQLTLKNEVLASWKNNRKEIEKKMAPYGEWEHIRDIASKASANTLRIAAIMQFFHDENSETISTGAFQCAIDLMEWHLDQASRLFYPMSERYQFEQDVRELYTWIKNKFAQNNWPTFPKNDLEKYGPNRLRRSDKLTPVLNQLISQGLLGVIQVIPDRALYISAPLPNGVYPFPSNYHASSSINIIQAYHNTNGRGYSIDLSGL